MSDLAGVVSCTGQMPDAENLSVVGAETVIVADDGMYSIVDFVMGGDCLNVEYMMVFVVEHSISVER